MHAQQTAHRTAVILPALAAITSLSASACGTSGARRTANGDTAEIRRELEALYQRNADAFERHDVPAIMAPRDRAAMETCTKGSVHHVETWVRQRETWVRRNVNGSCGGSTSFEISAG